MGKEQVHNSRRLTSDETADLTRRALVAWQTGGGDLLHSGVPVTARIATKAKTGESGKAHSLHHVVVHAGVEILTIYRVRTDNLGLRRMARPPKDLVRLRETASP